MREGRTLTRSMRLEARQHEMLGMDLGEGFPRAMLGFSAIVMLIWWGLALLLFGIPSQRNFTFYFVPPILLAAFGWREGTNPRRRRVTEWALLAIWVLRGHRPVIALGRREPGPGELTALSERLAQRLGDNKKVGKVVNALAVKRRRKIAAGAGVGDRSLAFGGPVQMVSTSAAQGWLTARRTVRRTR